MSNLISHFLGRYHILERTRMTTAYSCSALPDALPEPAIRPCDDVTA